MDFSDRRDASQSDKIGQLPAGWSLAFFDTAPSSNEVALAALAEQEATAAGRC